MHFNSIYFNLKRCLHSDPDYILPFDNEEEEIISNRNQFKRPRLQVQVEQLQPPIKTDWKLIFEIEDEEYKTIKFQAHNLLNEIFMLTFDWESGKLFSKIYKIDSTFDAINRAFPFRNSIFNTPLGLIPDDLKCEMTCLPRVIVELMRLLGQAECLKTLGAFRVEAMESKSAQLESLISIGMERSGSSLNEISIIGKMSLLKRFFRSIPGHLVNNSITNLMFSICISFDDSPCLNIIIRWLLSCLPLENYKALAFLCLLLNSYAKNEAYNLMAAESLAICWSPIVFDIDVDVDMISKMTNLLTLFIKKWDKFFLYPLKH